MDYDTIAFTHKEKMTQMVCTDIMKDWNANDKISSMSFFTISNGKIETYERRNTGIQDVFYEGRDSLWDIEEQKYKKPKSDDVDVEHSDGINATKHTRHYPFVSFRRHWHGWADRTTFHGISIVFNNNARILRRIFWLGFIIYMLYSICSGCLTQLNRFLAYKTLNQETIFYQEKLEFPSVTICNFNRIYNDTVHDERDRQILRHLYMNPSNSPTLMQHPGPEYTRNVSVRKLFKESAMAVDEMFKSCAFDGQDFHNCSEILEGRVLGTYFCHTVNPDGLNQLFETSVVGSDYGLTITLWTNQDKYFISDSASAGFKVVVHEKGEEPNIEQALALGPGYSHYLSIRKSEYHYKKYPVKAFGDRECLDTTADSFVNPLKYSAKYSYNACNEECWSNYVYRMCGCVGPSDRSNRVECNPFELIECYKDAYANFSSNQCSCSLPCHVTTYNTKLSSAYFPNSNFFKQLHGNHLRNVSEPFNIKTTREDALLLRVFFDSNIVTRHEQVLEFNKEDLFSSLGGYLGLFIGASLVSLLEFVEHVFISFIQCCIPKATSTKAA